MSIKSKIDFIRRDKKNLPNYILEVFSKFFSDKKYIKVKYKLNFGDSINLNKPTSFNEKLNWLKLYYHNPLLTLLADKYWVKQYVAKRIGEEYVVPCYGHWKSLEEINFDELPNVFFLKSNQDSGGGVLVDKSVGIKMSVLKKRFSPKNVSKKNWFWSSREWVYKHVEPCILAEEYLDEGTGHELQDYKFWCFNGVPTYMYVTNKGKVVKENFYDMDFKPVDIDHGFERTIPEYNKPDNFDKMKDLAKNLSEGIPFVRIDFFNVKGKLYFGEFTFYDWAGFRPFESMNQDIRLGNLLQLPQI